MTERYVIVDGLLQRSSPETARWTKRAARSVPTKGEPEGEPEVDLRDRRTDFEIIQDLEETDGDKKDLEQEINAFGEPFDYGDKY